MLTFHPSCCPVCGRAFVQLGRRPVSGDVRGCERCKFPIAYSSLQGWYALESAELAALPPVTRGTIENWLQLTVRVRA